MGRLFTRLRLIPSTIRSRGMKDTLSHTLRVLGELSKYRLVGPREITVFPCNFLCESSCPMCVNQKMDKKELQELYRKDVTDRMSADDYRRFIDTLPIGVSRITVCGGGEPLAHPDCITLLRLVKKHGYYGTLVTNGIRITEDMAQALVDIDWDLIRVSLNAGDKATYARVSGIDAFERVKENLKRYTSIRTEKGRHTGTKLCAFFVLQRANICTVDEMLSTAEEIGADQVKFDTIRAIERTDDLTKDEIATLVQNLKDANSRSRIASNAENVIEHLERRLSAGAGVESTASNKHIRCAVGFHNTMVKASGDVVPCPQCPQVMGNVRRNSLGRIWYGKAYNNFRERTIRGHLPSYCASTMQCCPAYLLRISD